MRATNDSDSVNADLKHLLSQYGIDPAVPAYVVGGFNFVLKSLQRIHKCSGRDCVQRHRQLFLEKKKGPKDGNVRCPEKVKKRVKNTNGGKLEYAKDKKNETASASKKDVPNYFI